MSRLFSSSRADCHWPSLRSVTLLLVRAVLGTALFADVGNTRLLAEVAETNDQSTPVIASFAPAGSGSDPACAVRGGPFANRTIPVTTERSRDGLARRGAGHFTGCRIVGSHGLAQIPAGGQLG